MQWQLRLWILACTFKPLSGRGWGGWGKYFPHLLLVCSFVLSPVPTHKKNSSEILCLRFLILFFTLCGSCSLCFLNTMANPISHCLFPPKTDFLTLGPSLPLLVLPMSGWMEAGTWKHSGMLHPSCTVLSHDSAEHNWGSQCAAQVHNWKQNCGFGEPNVRYRGNCLTEVVPMPQLMSLWSMTKPTKNQHSDVLAAAEVKDKVSTCFGGASSRLGIQCLLN